MLCDRADLFTRIAATIERLRFLAFDDSETPVFRQLAGHVALHQLNGLPLLIELFLADLFAALLKILLGLLRREIAQRAGFPSGFVFVF